MAVGNWARGSVLVCIGGAWVKILLGWWVK